MGYGYNEVFSYLDEKENALSQRSMRLKEKVTDTLKQRYDNVEQLTQNLSSTTFNNNNNNKNDNAPNITQTISTGYDNFNNDEDRSISSLSSSSSSLSKPSINRYDNSPDISSSFSSNKARYDNTSNTTQDISSSEGSYYSYKGVDQSQSSYRIYNVQDTQNSDPYSIYGSKTTNGGSNDPDDDNQSKKPYFIHDISENDLLVLESLVKYKKDLEPLPNTEKSVISSQPRLVLQSVYEEDQIQLNPYSSYSHPKFLTNDINVSNTSGTGLIGAKKMENISLYTWSSEFQRLLDMDDCLEKFERLSSLEHDFVYAAESYGRIIISENFLANELKTIKPVNVGGIAGGEKYIVQGILFKFALENETFGLYGNDENAMKTAAHELNGCASFLNCGIKGLHVPLMAFIDYRGFRLMAMSLLPISKKSLIYGSCDAGQTVHTSNNIFNNLFSNASKAINIKQHHVEDINGDIKTICGPIDIEGHLGSDSRFYLLDFARLSPPEPPKYRGSYLYKLLRLELVRKHQKPLCSDAFSPMSTIDTHKHNSEVQEAYDNLINNIIPKFSQDIQTRDGIGLCSNFLNDVLLNISSKVTNISKLLHAEGINIRYLGEVASHCTSLGFKRFFVIEAIVRTLKSLARELLRREMKKTHLPSDYPYRSLLLKLLNLLFDEYNDKTEYVWNKIILEKMEKKFQNIFVDKNTHKEEPELNDKCKADFPVTPKDILKSLLKNGVTRQMILHNFCKSIGLVISKLAIDQFSTTDSFIFVDTDIEEIKTLSTRLNLIDHADGMSLYYKSMAPGLSDTSKNRLLTISKERLEQSLLSINNSFSIVIELSKVLTLLAKTTQDSSNKKKYFDLANKKLSEFDSIGIVQSQVLILKIHRVRNALSHMKVGRLSDKEIEEIEIIINEIIEQSPDKVYPNYLLAKFFNSKSSFINNFDYSKVTSAYNNVLKIDSNYQKAHIGISLFLLNTQSKHKLFSQEKVSDHISKAFSVSKDVESIIGKIKPLVDFSPWIFFEISRNVPKLRLMVKNSLEVKYSDNKNKAIVPFNIQFEVEDLDYFENIRFEKVYFDEHINSNNIEVFSKIKPDIHSIILRKLKLDDFNKLNSLSRFSKITYLNFGLTQSGINEWSILQLITPNIKKLKLYEIPEITDLSVGVIAANCKDLEVLDLGGCKSIFGENLSELYKGCPSIIKLALPPCVDDQKISEAVSQLRLIKLDLMKCSKVTYQYCLRLLETSTTLKKIRTPIGIPLFHIGPQNLVSRHEKFAQHEPALRYSIGGMELFNIKISSPQGNKTYELFFNNKHPLVKFRDPLNPSTNFFKVAHISNIKNHSTQINIHKFFGNGWAQIESTSQFQQNLPVSIFKIESLGIAYQFLLDTSGGFQFSAFTNELSISNKPVALVTNKKSCGAHVDIEIKSKISIIPIFLTVASSGLK
ncbi:hypothetical protein RB653_002634 [Dictyostelium firmibasis]|uniref:Clu domain-containing protein n=1 Tax=Dictyostelium firmibasis TaxID=79012 RepID=A0AAN7TQV4_9MYCE